ncbi:hypothetical protein ACUJ46_05960 [Sandaracinobacteroides sp. A072]|uniref:hypothetical protein n=1 Tax=Sandaracinobacteroides sp. A072 TaxID=3461146 RepID=UPI0040419DC1
MMLAVVSTVAVLILIIMLNRGMFQRLGARKVLEMALIWTLILLGLAGLVRLLGLA